MLTQGDRDRGTVTIEAALGIGSIVAVLAIALGGMAFVIGQLRCTDAAVEAARLVSRGEWERADVVVAHLGPRGAQLDVAVRGDQVTALVRAPSPGGFPPGLGWESRAHSILEPGVSAEGMP